jgi:DNA-binding PadR family transcriptional regulator
MIRNLTIYDIKTTLEKKISPFYAASYGSIQNAIKNLLANQQIGFSEMVKDGRNKKVYFITQAGKKAFFDWMLSEIPVNKFNNEVLVRVFFFGFIQPEDQTRLLDDYVKKLKIEYEEMCSFQTNLKVPESFQDKKEIIKFQLHTLDFGVQQLRLEIEWFEELQRSIQKEDLHAEF